MGGAPPIVAPDRVWVAATFSAAIPRPVAFGARYLWLPPITGTLVPKRPRTVEFQFGSEDRTSTAIGAGSNQSTHPIGNVNASRCQKHPPKVKLLPITVRACFESNSRKSHDFCQQLLGIEGWQQQCPCYVQLAASRAEMVTNPRPTSRPHRGDEGLRSQCSNRPRLGTVRRPVHDGRYWERRYGFAPAPSRGCELEQVRTQRRPRAMAIDSIEPEHRTFC